MPVTVFTQPNCQPCRITKIHLEKRGVEYREVDISKDPEAVNYLLSLGYKSAPVVLTKDLHWSGLRLDLIDDLIPGEPNKV